MHDNIHYQVFVFNIKITRTKQYFQKIIPLIISCAFNSSSNFSISSIFFLLFFQFVLMLPFYFLFLFLSFLFQILLFIFYSFYIIFTSILLHCISISSSSFILFILIISSSFNSFLIISFILFILHMLSSFSGFSISFGFGILLCCNKKSDFFFNLHDDDELFLWYGCPTKGVWPYFQPGPLSEILTISNLRHVASRI